MGKEERSVGEELQSPLVEVVPRNEQQLPRGNRKEFSENLEYNLSLIVDRLPKSGLVSDRFRVGRLSEKTVTMVYLQNRANPAIVKEVRGRIRAMKAEVVLDGSYVERNLEDSNLSPFPQLEITRKPDITESALAQGRIAIIIEGSPEVLLAPATFFDLMDTPEDAFRRWYVASSFFRVARLIMFIFAVALPGFYVALISFNPELMPTTLLFTVLAAREGTPFPAYFEAFLMMGIAEAVRMMVIRIPGQVGGTIGLFAGLTLVGAGLFANIIAAPIVIIVTLTVISSFAIPSSDLRSAIRLVQFIMLIAASLFGLYGIAVVFFYIAVHLVSLKSFGIPYMSPLAPLEAGAWGHIMLRDNTVMMPPDETYHPQTTESRDNQRGGGVA